MPINQALTARSHTGLVLHRAIAMLCVGTALLLPALLHTPIACALALSCAALLINTWYINLALPRLGLSMSDLSAAAPPLIAAVIVVLTVLLTPSLPLLAQMICGTFLYFGIDTLLRDPQMRPA